MLFALPHAVLRRHWMRFSFLALFGLLPITVAHAQSTPVGQVRYYPRVGHESRMVGGLFQGSSDNTNWTTLYTVTATPTDTYTTAALTTDPATFRYLRYLAPASSCGNVAEIEFDSGTGTNAVKLTGTAFGTAGSYNNDGDVYTYALDGATSTFFDAPAPGNGDYVGFDQGVAAGQIRYYPVSGYEGRMVGGQFQGSSDNANWTVLYTITSAPTDTMTAAALATDPRTYRYLRYLAPASSYGNVAEIGFYSGTGINAIKLTGTSFGTAGSYNNDGEVYTNALDGNTSTFFNAPAPGNGDYVGIDEGTTTPVTVTATGGDAQTLVTWAPVSGATGYNVFRSTSSGGEGTTPINGPAPISANAYIDTGLTAGTSYYYTVAAVFNSVPQSGQSTEAVATTSASGTLQDTNWTVSYPTGSNTPSATVNAAGNATSISSSLGTTLLASALVAPPGPSGTITSNVTTSAEANCSGTWTFTWTGTAWPTLYVIQHVKKMLYSASVNAGTGNAQVAITGGTTLVSAAYPPTGTQLIGLPATVFSFNTADLTQPSLTSTTTFHIAGAMPAPGMLTGALTGWSETSSSTALTQLAYTQAWFQSHFTSPSKIVLSFSVPTSDVTVTTNLSNSTYPGSASALANVIDDYSGS